MVSLLSWTAWNLTDSGWRKSITFKTPEDAVKERPAETLIAVVESRFTDAPMQAPMRTELFRSRDKLAVDDALVKFGSRPTD